MKILNSEKSKNLQSHFSNVQHRGKNIINVNLLKKKKFKSYDALVERSIGWNKTTRSTQNKTGTCAITCLLPSSLTNNTRMIPDDIPSVYKIN